ncbi:PREDICTED: probable G-protein coupled receptor B0563.6 [Dinoponera quadriceps]|uniref:Probable G-protein coupled receptor B0563.6 n=1 Tax=Dinoponera quadriceps TaxID=609295 RepID=A0A6P3XBN8_DINQU|nr:PREDICTED: probable G-protein coupled receptor B0563.6 [Dinoponera quadriceps]
MLTGVIDGTLLCCDNFTTGRVSVEDDVIRNRAISSLVWTSYGIVVPIILTVGIFGNVAILIVLSGPMFRGIAYLYLSGLALAHVGVVLSWMTITLRLGYGMSENYLLAFYHAHFELVILNAFSAASVLIMVCLIVDRYIFVFFPARIRTGNARKNASSFILSSFIAGFMISVPLSSMRIIYKEQDGSSASFILHENASITRSVIWRIYIWTMEIAVRICPSILFIVLNSFVIKRFLQLNAQNRQFHAVSDKYRGNNAPDTSLLSRNRGYKEEQHLAIMTTTMILCFFVTTLPSSLVPMLYPNRHPLDLRYQTFRVCSAIVELGNYVVYILIYLVCSTEFRRALLRFLQGRCNENIVQDTDQPVGEIEDFSRHGTTVRLTPEHTKLNSSESPTSKEAKMEEDSHSLDATASMLEHQVIA